MFACSIHYTCRETEKNTTHSPVGKIHPLAKYEFPFSLTKLEQEKKKRICTNVNEIAFLKLLTITCTFLFLISTFKIQNMKSIFFVSAFVALLRFSKSKQLPVQEQDGNEKIFSRHLVRKTCLFIATAKKRSQMHLKLGIKFDLTLFVPMLLIMLK